MLTKDHSTTTDDINTHDQNTKVATKQGDSFEEVNVNANTRIVYKILNTDRIYYSS